MTKLFNGLSNATRAGAVTGLFASGLTFLTTASAWLADVQEAVDNGTEIPDPSILASGAISLVVGVTAGATNGAWRWWQERSRRGAPPVYPEQRR